MVFPIADKGLDWDFVIRIWFWPQSRSGNSVKAFECTMCGECCYGTGGIFLTQEEIERIARFLAMNHQSFLVDCCEERNGRIYLKSGTDGYCIFFDREKGCSIHPVKPERCALWPYYAANLRDRETWETAKEACPGINPDCPFDEFVRQSKE
jgi:hypothetical protein